MVSSLQKVKPRTGSFEKVKKSSTKVTPVIQIKPKPHFTTSQQPQIAPLSCVSPTKEEDTEADISIAQEHSRYINERELSLSPVEKTSRNMI